MSRRRANLWLLLITVIWGSTFIVVKQSLDLVGPFTFVAARFLVAAAAVALLTRVRRVPRTPGLIRDGLFTGLFLTLGFVTQTIGLQSTAASKAAFITGLNVVLVPLFAALLFRTMPPVAALAGVALATGGLALMTLDPATPLDLAAGDLWTMACALFFALHILSIAHFSPRHRALPFTLVQLISAALLSGSAALAWERGALVPPLAALPAIVYMGLVATALVFALQSWAQRYTTPTHAALIFAMEPVSAALVAILFAGEALLRREWLGGGIILVGMIIAEVGSHLAPVPPAGSAGAPWPDPSSDGRPPAG